MLNDKRQRFSFSEPFCHQQKVMPPLRCVKVSIFYQAVGQSMLKHTFNNWNPFTPKLEEMNRALDNQWKIDINGAYSIQTKYLSWTFIQKIAELNPQFQSI